MKTAREQAEQREKQRLCQARLRAEDRGLTTAGFPPRVRRRRSAAPSHPHSAPLAAWACGGSFLDFVPSEPVRGDALERLERIAP